MNKKKVGKGINFVRESKPKHAYGIILKELGTNANGTVLPYSRKSVKTR